MKKILAVAAAIVCVSCCMLSSFALTSEVASGAGDTSAVVSDVVSGDVSGIESDTGDVSEALPVESETPDVSSDNETVPDTEGTTSVNVIVNYAAGHDDMAGLHLDAIIWTVCGVLLFGCLCLLVYKIIQYRNSK